MSQNVPSSWNYGSFHLDSRLYTAGFKEQNDAVNHSHVVQTDMEKTSKTTTTEMMLPPRAPFGTDQLNHSLDDTAKKVATEDYYRALKTYKQV